MEAMKAIVTFAKPYSFQDERTKENKEGITVEYIMIDSMKPVTNEDGSKGTRHSSESLNIDKASRFSSVPGIYDLHFDFKPASKGKIQLKLVDVAFVSTLMKG